MGNIFKQKLQALKKKKEKREKDTLRNQYLADRERPLDENAVLLEARNGKEINGNIYYMLRELLTDQAYEDRKLYVSAEPEKKAEIQRKINSLPNGAKVQVILIETEEYYRAAATVKYILCDATLKNFFIKREGQVYLNLWHGTPFKVMGRKVIHEPHAVGNAQKNFTIADYLLYPNRYMMNHMVEDYMIANTSHATILLGGYPRNTAFFDEEKRSQIKKEKGLENTRIYIYMPTYRPELMGETLAGVLRQMDQELGEGEVLFAKIHPLASDSVNYGEFKYIQPFPEEYETYEFLNLADVLITDYSSVFYDFAVTGRKIVLYTYDEEEYLSTRGLYEPMSSLPFDQVKTVRDVMACARSPKAYDDIEFRAKYCRLDSPSAAKVLCERVFQQKKSALLEEIPMPSNGKPNIMIDVENLEPGDRTDRLLDYLKNADQASANYFVTFQRKDVEAHKEMIFELPPGVDYFGRAGKAYHTGNQQQDQDLEQLRCFGTMRIDDFRHFD